jgi:hypothetical protein
MERLAPAKARGRLSARCPRLSAHGDRGDGWHLGGGGAVAAGARAARDHRLHRGVELARPRRARRRATSQRSSGAWLVASRGALGGPNLAALHGIPRPGATEGGGTPLRGTPVSPSNRCGSVQCRPAGLVAAGESCHHGPCRSAPVTATSAPRNPGPPHDSRRDETRWRLNECRSRGRRSSRGSR